MFCRSCRYLIYILLCVSIHADAQQERIWIFGAKGSGGATGAGIDFTSVTPVPLQSAINGFGESNASVCDDNGQLLFYTEGSYVWNRNNVIMPGGSDITGIAPSSTLQISPTSSTTQGALIVPVPGSRSRYYIFSLTSNEYGPGRLFYSIVDMRQDNGLGDVEQKAIRLDSNLSEKMIAVVGDNCNIWLIARSVNMPVYKTWSITESGITQGPASVVASPDNADNIGMLAASLQRDKLAACNGSGRVEVYDFDPATGIISNTRRIDSFYYYGAAFSPDGSRLYITPVLNGYQVVQYDLTATDPATTKVLLGTCDFSQIRMAENNRLYFITNRTTGTIGSIGNPNGLGAASLYTANAVQVPATAAIYGGLPNVVPVLRYDTVYKRENILACFTDSIVLSTPLISSNHLWSDGTTGKEYAVHTNGVYRVSYTMPPCTYHTDTFIVTMSGKPPAAGSRVFCVQENDHLYITPAPGDTTIYSYTWYNPAQQLIRLTPYSQTGDTLHPSVTGTYYVHTATAARCDTVSEIEYNAAGIRASFTVDTVICQTDTLHFQNTSTGSFAAFHWRFGNGDTASGASPVYHYAAPGRYRVTMTGITDSLCYDSASVYVRIDTIPQVSFTVTGNDLCQATPIHFYPVYTQGADTLLWQFGNGPAVAGWQPMYSFDYTGPVIVRLTGKYPHCADTSFTDTIVLHPYPLVNIGADTALCPGNASISLYNLAAANAGDIYTWSTGSADDAIAATDPGVYWLTVTTPHGCSTTDTLLVRRSCYLDIPNAFSPNGDGVNDYFFPKADISAGIIQLHFQVFNRWGQLLFETANTTGRGWDGRFNGEPQPQGVYIYYAAATFANGIVENYRANVTLFR